MKIHHQGWNETVGAFNCDVTLDEQKSDYEIIFPGGMVSHQQTPFHAVTRDWDQNGTPYTKVGAYFTYNSENEFFTPLELVSLVLYGSAYIPGLQIEDRQLALDDRIQAASRRASALQKLQREEHTKPKQPHFR